MTVASYNLLHGINLRDGHIDLDAAAHAIAGLSADVVALQEVDRGQPRTGGVDQVGELARRLGWTGVFAPALLGSPDTSWTVVGDADQGGAAYGVGLLSAAPLHAVARRQLPGGGDGQRPPVAPVPRTAPPWPGYDREPRVALAATHDAGLRITTTHLSYLPWRGLAQLRAALEFAADGPGPAVLVGDLNLPAWPVRLAGRAAGWRHAGGSPTYPSWNPRLQTDQLLVRGEVDVVRARVGPAGTSDHLPFVATVAVA